MDNDPPRISASLFRYVVGWLQQRQLDVAELLRAEGIDPAIAEQSDRFASLAAYVSFFERAARVTGMDHLGLRIGRIEDPANLGLLGTLFMSAPDLLDALGAFSQNLHVLQGSTLNRISLSGDAAEIEYRILDPSIIRRRQDAEFSIAANASLVGHFSGGKLRPREVYFEHQRAGEYADYRDHFQCDVFFEQHTNALVYERDGFNVGNSLSHPMLAQIISDYLEQLARASSHPPRIAETVRMLLGTGLSGEREVAGHLRMSVSTLIRKLKAEGECFRQIALAERMVRAQRMLLATDRPIVDVALEAGYAESSSFTRAFRKATGKTPSGFRRLRLAGD